MNTAAGASAGGSSDCEGEDQEDSSSSSLAVHEIENALDQVSIGNIQPKSTEDELSVFRQQWQRELESTPSPQKQILKPSNLEQENDDLSDEDKAKKLFLRGVELERGGKLYEAIQHYKRAIQILPDVETRLYDGTEQRNEPSEDEYEVEHEVFNTNAGDESDDEDAVEGEDFLARLQRIVAKKGHLCQPNYDPRGCHISWLPYEVVLLIVRWVVSSELDAVALERVAAVCRGLYVTAREHDIWRSICVKTWGIECGVPRNHGFASWRQMYVERPRLNLNGCYISKTTYLRHGENSFQDHFYRPWYLVDYYRYLRFFSEGTVLMWTTAEEPASSLPHLKHRLVRNNLGIMPGHYRLYGNKVVIVIKKCSTEKKASQSSNTRFRARRKEAIEQQEQIFHMEFELRDVRSCRNHQLVWRQYSVSTRDHWSHFELVSNKYPPFAFSRVRSYTDASGAPLS